MPPRLPSLAAIRAFDTSARTLSFTRAAAELGVTQAAISWQIKELETRLGRRLFERGKPGLRLTETGSRIAHAAAAALRDLEAAFDMTFHSTDAVRTLRVSVSPSFASIWLVPRLGAFHSACPKITVDVEATGEIANLEGGGADIAIRHATGPWPHLLADRLLPIVLAPVCAPRLVASLPASTGIDGLASMPMLQPLDLCGHWFAGKGRSDLLAGLRSAATYRQDHTTIQAAVAGQGLAFLNPLFCSELLADRRLVQLAPTVTVPGSAGYWQLRHKGSASDPDINAFRTWILAEIGSSSS